MAGSRFHTNVSLHDFLQMDKTTFSCFITSFRASYDEFCERIGQGLIVYHPRQHPHDAQIQQNFSRVVHQSVKDVLALNLPPPQAIPSVFYT